MVDVYHELAYPFEVMTKIREALKPGGRVVFLEYRKEDPDVPIKLVHKMSVEQVKREMKAVGLAHMQTLETLQIGRASCRERGEMSEGGGTVRKDRGEQTWEE